MFGAAEHHPAHISQVRQCATPSARRARQRVFTLPSGELALIVKPAMHGAGRIVLRYLQPWYKINGEIKDREPDIRRRIRQEKAVLVMDVLTAWRVAQRDIVHNGSATGKVLNYSLKRWPTFSCYLDDGPVAIETIGVKTRSGLRLGRKNWVFARSPPSGKRAAANMGLIL
ncbi:transposase [Pseudomonas sp. PS01300]|uniref:IS66 family transposase n=1 Tax=Pseudomonas sp. PS01300 TaxID=2991436 RepID=UPI00249CCFF3|nr:transposase [Pseudomonas sp. PS01300]